MNRLNKEQIARLSITLLILFSGVALLPFVNLPAGAIGWESLAGAYAPELSVDEDSGAPGSLFAFTGSGYPPHSLATIYIDAEASGQVLTDAQGGATFILNTVGANAGVYNVTLEVDANASATENIEIIAGDTLLTLPTGFAGPTVYINPPLFLPVVIR